jgi:hypothetical protein
MQSAHEKEQKISQIVAARKGSTPLEIVGPKPSKIIE